MEFFKVGDRVQNICKCNNTLCPKGLDNHGKFGRVKDISNNLIYILYDDGNTGNELLSRACTTYQIILQPLCKYHCTRCHRIFDNYDCHDVACFGYPMLRVRECEVLNCGCVNIIDREINREIYKTLAHAFITTYIPNRIATINQEELNKELNKKGFMSNIIDKIKNLTLSDNEAALRRAGFEDEEGEMTEQAEDYVYDLLIEERWAAVKDKVAADVIAVEAKEKANK